MTWFPRTADGRRKMQTATTVEDPQGVLTCGCPIPGPPPISNPDRWFCCGAYRGKKRKR